ncbi:4Fe-4S dicluster domain-containing protein [Stakelama pacifica]|uniref:Molybdopterin-containing oxidoreductase family iron-sulfur binding subunit n=1 Tax=Stakelama pacifica TaxID=517720 RepID=A0A4R6FY50_9SPHN|nr:4Fe-4S dicluster domain-containing protein [Stakelama pacifica]TDN86882.1 molybdopterin-containing oxidoreductase family iron-sulfur binding subunit [Stakelama pacifica]GGO90964.1 molybdopterin oxidoreductase [Stakelama pacifica]
MPSLSGDLDRRTLLQMIAAGAAASVAGCSAPNEKIYPYVNQPEGTLPGSIRRYATALPFAGYGRGVMGLVTDGRPIKLEGLAAHPASLGATDLFSETALLDLFDPQRVTAPGGPPGPTSWGAVARTLYERLHGSDGSRLALLTGRITSPTILRELKALRTRFPALRHVEWEPIHDDALLAGIGQATGRSALPRQHLAEADVIVSLGADPLGPGPEQIALARHWSERRRRRPAPRLYAAEPSLTATGAMADRRLSASRAELAAIAHHLAAELSGSGARPELSSAASDFARAAARDLATAKGRALLLAGHDQPADMHAFAAWANDLLQAPVDYIAPIASPAPHRRSLEALSGAMHGGAIDTLIVLDSNPVYSAPPAIDFAGGMEKVACTITATAFPNETAARSTWRLPLSHPLEEWNDWRGPDGTASIAQPLVRRFYDSRSAADIVALIRDPAADADSHGRVRASWADLTDQAWIAAVARGVVPNSAAPTLPHTGATRILPDIPQPIGPELQIRPSPTLWDGSHAHNAWVQECPDSITKEVWGASVRCHPADMAEWDVADGETLRIESGDRAVTLAARAASGQRRGVVTILTGYGRSDSGPVANGIGANAWRMVDADRLTLSPADSSETVVSTQAVFAIEGALASIFPIVAPGEAMPGKEAQATLLPNHAATDAPAQQWAMVIDNDVCIGCNACVVACQAENNVPVIGPEEMAAGRDMHWLRVDRYEVSAEGATGFQPVPCMHCEKAPCEPVCPVEASVHDSEGLNLQVYNRCIGTRTCEANCPYRVRRFNFFDYAERSVWGDEDPASVTAQRNPNVTVRGRGVMEKCTYCIQRISAAEHDADANHHPVGKVVTACQAACPTHAISFGSIADPASEVSRQKEDPRHYALLEELGTKPRTTYLARTLNDGKRHQEDKA